jgi:phage protein D
MSMDPLFSISSGGKDRTAAFADRLLALEVVDALGEEADRLTVTLDDRDQRIAIPPMGAVLEVQLGLLPGARVAVGEFAIDGLEFGEAPATFIVSGHSADLLTGIRAPRTGHWADTTLGEIVREVAGRHGLEPLMEPAVASHPVTAVEQAQESDLHLLTRLSRPLDALVKVVEGKLLVIFHGRLASVRGALMPVAPVLRTELSGWRWRSRRRQRYGSCRALWSDRKAGKTAEVIETASGIDGPRADLRRVHATEAEARRAATRHLTRLNRAGRSLTLDFAGFRADLAAGQPLRPIGLRTGVEGQWIAMRVTHRLDGSGLTTRAECLPPDEELGD